MLKVFLVISWGLREMIIDEVAIVISSNSQTMIAWVHESESEIIEADGPFGIACLTLEYACLKLTFLATLISTCLLWNVALLDSKAFDHFRLPLASFGLVLLLSFFVKALSMNLFNAFAIEFVA